MKVDERKFAAALAATGLTRDRFAALLGISRPTLSRRLSGVTEWRLREAILVRRILGVPLERLALATIETILDDRTEPHSDGAP